MLLSRRTCSVSFGIAVLIVPGQVVAAGSPVPNKRVALRGYDPVAYFTDNRPIQGSSEYWYEFDDTVYWFASAEHRTAFITDPDHYAPQYDGYCAMSVSIGERDEGLPNVWEIVDGKLYVFGKPTGVQDFATDPEGFEARGRANWDATHRK